MTRTLRSVMALLAIHFNTSVLKELAVEVISINMCIVYGMTETRLRQNPENVDSNGRTYVNVNDSYSNWKIRGEERREKQRKKNRERLIDGWGE